MIVPYIVESDAQARELSRSLGEQFQHIELPLDPAADERPEQP